VFGFSNYRYSQERKPSNLQIHLHLTLKEGYVMKYNHRTTRPVASPSARPPLVAAIAVFLLTVFLTGWSTVFASEAILNPGIWGQNILTTGDVFVFPVWSHDGKWIAVDETYKGIMIVPSEGGASRLVAEGYINYPLNGTTVKISTGQSLIGGFSSDDRYLYFTRVVLDEARGATIHAEIDEHGFLHYQTSSNAFSLYRVNVESGEIVEFIVGPSWCKVSPSGRAHLAP
jgi:hypothetical protein